MIFKVPVMRFWNIQSVGCEKRDRILKRRIRNCLTIKVHVRILRRRRTSRALWRGMLEPSSWMLIWPIQILTVITCLTPNNKSTTKLHIPPTEPNKVTSTNNQTRRNTTTRPSNIPIRKHKPTFQPQTTKMSQNQSTPWTITWTTLKNKLSKK